MGEAAALGDGGDVGPVPGQDRFQGVAGLGRVGGVGDDVEAVVVAASGGGHVQASVGCRAGDEGEGDVDGVALVAVSGGGVAEPHVAGGVLGGEGDGAVPVAVGHGQRPVVVHRVDGPQVAVVHGVAAGGGEGAVVAASGHPVAGMDPLPCGDGSGPGGVEVAGGQAGLLDGLVEQVDVVVGGGGDRHRAVGGQSGPGGGDGGDVVVEGAGVDAAVGLVGVEGGRDRRRGVGWRRRLPTAG